MRIGIIGIGYWGKKVLGEYLNLVDEKKIDSIGICDLNQNVLDLYKNKSVFVTNDLNKFLSSEDIDAVHICTNNSSHYDIAKAAIDAGKHVLLEKPMTTNSTQAYKLIEMATHNGIILQVGHIFRFANVIRKTKELVEKDYFGDIYYYKLKWTNLMNPISNVDVIWDLLPHPIDILNFITGEFPLNMNGIDAAYRRIGLSEMAFINLKFQKKFVANIELSWLSPKRRRCLEIVGSNRSADIDCTQQKIYIYENNEPFYEIPIESNNTIKEEQENFIKAIQSGKAMFNSHIIGARTVDIIEKSINTINKDQK